MVFTVRVTQSLTPSHGQPALDRSAPHLQDPIIVMLTYFRSRGIPSSPPCCRHEVPVSLLFFAYGYLDVDLICGMIGHTASFPRETIRQLLYVTLQHTSTIRSGVLSAAKRARGVLKPVGGALSREA